MLNISQKWAYIEKANLTKVLSLKGKIMIIHKHSKRSSGNGQFTSTHAQIQKFLVLVHLFFVRKLGHKRRRKRLLTLLTLLALLGAH